MSSKCGVALVCGKGNGLEATGCMGHHQCHTLTMLSPLSMGGGFSDGGQLHTYLFCLLFYIQSLFIATQSFGFLLIRQTTIRSKKWKWVNAQCFPNQNENIDWTRTSWQPSPRSPEANISFWFWKHYVLIRFHLTWPYCCLPDEEKSETLSSNKQDWNASAFSHWYLALPRHRAPHHRPLQRPIWI